MAARWPTGRIPITWPPLEGEGLDSWLASYAHRLRTPTRHFLTHLGLPGDSLPLLVRHLTDTEHELLRTRTGVDASTLKAMTLAPFNGTVIALDTATRKLGRPPSWKTSGARTRYCPDCLGDSAGRWQLSWRLPWSFACLRHHRLLLDACPACHVPPVMFKGGQIPDPGLCIRTVRGEPCGYDLATAPAARLSPHSAVLAAQEEIDRTILVPGHNDTAIHDYSQELRITALRILTALTIHHADAPALVRQVLDECGPQPSRRSQRDVGTDAHDTALSTTLARILLAALPPPAVGARRAALNGRVLPELALQPEQQQQVQAVWRWLLDSGLAQRSDTQYPIAWAHSWTYGSSRLASRALAHVSNELSWTTQLRYGTTTPAPAFPTLTRTQTEDRAAKIPAMLWPTWTLHLLPRTPTPTAGQQTPPVSDDRDTSQKNRQAGEAEPRVGSPLAGFRRAAAALLLVPGTDLTHPQAARRFGHSLAKPHWDALNTVLGDSPTTTITTVLVHLARALDAHDSPINYQRRRALFTTGELLFDTDAHDAYMRRHGRYTSTRHADHMRWQVRRLLLGAEPTDASTTPLWQQRNHHLIDPELHTLITQQAQRNLDAHRLDEPLTWEPPGSWLPEPLRPDAPDTGICLEPLAALMPSRPSLSRAAAAAGTTPDRLRLLYEACPDTAPAAPPITPTRRAGGNPIPRRGLLDPKELRRLYIDEQRSTPQIAALVGCTPSVIGRYLKEAGLPIRRRTQPLTAADGTLVTPAWLKTAYHDHGRTTIDIADELDCHNAYISHLLKRYGIPARPLFKPAPSPFARLGVDLSPAMKAVAQTRNHVARLRDIIRLPGHEHIAAAVQHLGLAPSSIRYQLDQIEKTTGFTIITRSPLIPTPQGQPFLDEATRLLKLLDAQAGAPRAFRPAGQQGIRTGQNL
uniref:TniQ family protein n=1 Tax=Streptomyces sp. NBC_00003 TaxID=2903608 RepID=A0AAU2VC43_9ACTN